MNAMMFYCGGILSVLFLGLAIYLIWEDRRKKENTIKLLNYREKSPNYEETMILG